MLPGGFPIPAIFQIILLWLQKGYMAEEDFNDETGRQTYW